MATDAGTQPSPPPPPSDQHHRSRRLVRYSDRGPLGGVCAGLGRYLGVNVTLVRIGAIVLACMGIGIPAYIVAWLVLPDADGRPVVPLDRAAPSGSDRVWQVVGICVIVVALSALFGDWWWPGRGWTVPIALVAVGAWLLFRSDDDDVPVPPTDGGSSPWRPSTPTVTSVAPAPPTPPAGAAEATSTENADGTDTTDVMDAGADTLVGLPPDGGDGPPTEGLEPTEPTEPPAAPRSRRRRVLGPLVFGGLLLWGGIAWLAGVSVEDGLAIGLCILGAGFVIGAFVGGSKVLVLPALLIAGALVAVSVIDIPLHGGIGDRRWEITSMRDLDDRYELAIGEATLDLSGLDVASGRVPHIEMEVGMGHLEVIVPEGATVDVTAEAGAGDVQVLGYTDEGMGVELERTILGDADGDRFELELHVGLGQIEVYEARRPPARIEPLGPVQPLTPVRP